MRFDVGQEVVCIDDNVTEPDGTRLLKKGRHYIIRWIGLWEEIECVRVVGISRPWVIEYAKKLAQSFGLVGDDLDALDRLAQEFQDMPFKASRFAPIEKQQQTDQVEVLKQLFLKPKVSEPA